MSSHPVQWLLLWSSLMWDTPDDAAKAFIGAAVNGQRTVSEQLDLFPATSTFPERAPESVVEAFAIADSYADVMIKLNVSRTDVVRWLEQDPTLRTEWRERLRSGRLRTCTERIRAAALHVETITRQSIERECSAEVRWLREHAPSTLTALMKSIPSRSSSQSSIFDSDQNC